jgi:hypothetical protein
MYANVNGKQANNGIDGDTRTHQILQQPCAITSVQDVFRSFKTITIVIKR